MEKFLNPDYLNTFLTVAETGQFNTAAQLVYRSHSAVSMQIKHLEEQIGGELFLRNKNSLSLTKKGQLLKDYGEKLLALNDEVLNLLQGKDKVKNIPLGVAPEYSDFLTEKVLPLLEERLPEYTFTVTCARSRPLRTLLDEGRIQFAILGLEPDFKDGIFLWEEPLLWVKNRDFQYREGEVLPVAILDDNCLLYNFALYSLKHAPVRFQITYTGIIVENLLSAVRTGRAVSLLGETWLEKDFLPVKEEILSCPFSLKTGCQWNDALSPEEVDVLVSTVREGTRDTIYQKYVNPVKSYTTLSFTQY